MDKEGLDGDTKGNTEKPRMSDILHSAREKAEMQQTEPASVPTLNPQER